MSFYPKKIGERFKKARNAGKIKGENASATSATFVCGAVLRLSLQIEKATKKIAGAKFQTNGCGFLIAAADVLAEAISGEKLIDLQFANKTAWLEKIEARLGEFPPHRKHCLELCAESFESAFADFRRSQIEEFAGEKALICTCFGVSEETVERVIKENAAQSVSDVARICKAGGGCGSCRFLIQELIDVYCGESA